MPWQHSAARYNVLSVVSLLSYAFLESGATGRVIARVVALHDPRDLQRVWMFGRDAKLGIPACHSGDRSGLRSNVLDRRKAAGLVRRGIILCTQ